MTSRDEGRCRFPGCRAARNVEIHHIVPRAQGGGHDAANLLLLCDGHHKLLHDGIVTICGHAPDALVFTRDGKRLVDARAAAEWVAPGERAMPGDRGTPGDRVTPGERVAPGQRFAPTGPSRTMRNRFADAGRLEHATQALKQLGFKTREAKRALEQACAHVGLDAEVGALVTAVLGLQRIGAFGEAARTDAPRTRAALATQALVQAGFARPIAERAVDAARVHVGTEVTLEALIKEALRHCQ